MSLEQAIVAREEAEAMIAEVRVDEPELAEVLEVVPLEFRSR